MGNYFWLKGNVVNYCMVVCLFCCNLGVFVIYFGLGVVWGFRFSLWDKCYFVVLGYLVFYVGCLVVVLDVIVGCVYVIFDFGLRNLRFGVIVIVIFFK